MPLLCRSQNSVQSAARKFHPTDVPFLCPNSNHFPTISSRFAVNHVPFRWGLLNITSFSCIKWKVKSTCLLWSLIFIPGNIRTLAKPSKKKNTKKDVVRCNQKTPLVLHLFAQRNKKPLEVVVEDLALLKEQVRAAVSFRFNLFWGLVWWGSGKWMARISVLGWFFCRGMEKADILIYFIWGAER